MRLTLRTLLSYLDDTLEPAQAKAIGQKVAESEQARDLVERIKQVTRRRRLTTPPAAGPGGIDPNTIGEYLDNEVTPEQAAEVEQICLASDVHLAEVAGCHQILTLVLGEPALVPPSAKQRMYALVKGPESIPFRKPPKAGTKDDLDLSSEIDGDMDDTLRMGVPAVGGKAGSSKIWLFASGGVVAVGVFIFAVWMLVNQVPVNKGEPKKDGTLVQGENKEGGKKIEPPKDDDKKKETPETDKKKDSKPEKIEVPKTDGKLPEIKPIDVVPVEIKPPPDIKFGPASKKQAPVGQYVMPGLKEPGVLLQAKPDKSGWTRIAGKGTPAVSGRSLLSLPGSKCAVALDSGVELTLWGNLVESNPDPLLSESRATLHSHDLLDADLTLERGRILLRNNKKGEREALARVRFNDPMQTKEDYFDIVMQPGAAVAIELVADLDPAEPFFEDPKNPMRKGPIAVIRVFAFAGFSTIRHEEKSPHSLDETQHTLAQWQNREGTLVTQSLKAAPPWFKGKTPLKDKNEQMARDKAIEAHEYLAKLMDKDNKQIDVALAEITQTVQQSAQREIDKQKFMSLETYILWRHALRCTAAIDDTNSLFDTLATDGTPVAMRAECITLLRHWLAQERDNDYQLLEIVRKNNIKKTPSIKIMELFHIFPQAEAKKPATYQHLIESLNNELMPIRMLSHWHLVAYLAPAGRSIPYDPSMPRAQREMAVRAWMSLIPPGQLPPTSPPTKKKDKG